jgi:hypothetical protein
MKFIYYKSTLTPAPNKMDICRSVQTNLEFYTLVLNMTSSVCIGAFIENRIDAVSDTFYILGVKNESVRFAEDGARCFPSL